METLIQEFVLGAKLICGVVGVLVVCTAAAFGYVLFELASTWRANAKAKNDKK